MAKSSSVEQYLRQILLLKQQVTEIQEKLQQIESSVQFALSSVIDRNKELESLAYFDSDSGEPICNLVD